MKDLHNTNYTAFLNITKAQFLAGEIFLIYLGYMSIDWPQIRIIVIISNVNPQRPF